MDLLLLTALLVAPVQQGGQPNQLTPAEKAAGWQLLFDGKSFAGWHGFGYDTVPSAHWVLDDGAIRKIPTAKVAKTSDGKTPAGSDLVTIRAFDEFELSFDWKVAPGANSGVKYNLTEPYAREHNSPHSALGFEYQIEDDSLGDDIALASHRTGALYDLIAPNGKKHLRPVGEWNNSRIVYQGNHIEHWLNGALILSFDLATAHMDSLIAASKYKSLTDFAIKRTGQIVLQDHGDEAWYRSIKILVLSSPKP